MVGVSKKWDQRFLTLARLVGSWSKDPSTQVGAVVVRPDKTVASLGFNGFPRFMEDRDTRLVNRPDKYDRTVHAEMNALLFTRERLDGFTMYVTFPMCHRCAVHVVQAGIKRVVCGVMNEDDQSRWGESANRAVEYLRECGVGVDFVGT